MLVCAEVVECRVKMVGPGTHAPSGVVWQHEGAPHADKYATLSPWGNIKPAFRICQSLKLAGAAPAPIEGQLLLLDASLAREECVSPLKSERRVPGAKEEPVMR